MENKETNEVNEKSQQELIERGKLFNEYMKKYEEYGANVDYMYLLACKRLKQSDIEQLEALLGHTVLAEYVQVMKDEEEEAKRKEKKLLKKLRQRRK